MTREEQAEHLRALSGGGNPPIAASPPLLNLTTTPTPNETNLETLVQNMDIDDVEEEMVEEEMVEEEMVEEEMVEEEMVEEALVEEDLLEEDLLEEDLLEEDLLEEEMVVQMVDAEFDAEEECELLSQFNRLHIHPDVYEDLAVEVDTDAVLHPSSSTTFSYPEVEKWLPSNDPLGSSGHRVEPRTYGGLTLSDDNIDTLLEDPTGDSPGEDLLEVLRSGDFYCHVTTTHALLNPPDLNQFYTPDYEINSGILDSGFLYPLCTRHDHGERGMRSVWMVPGGSVMTAIAHVRNKWGDLLRREDVDLAIIVIPMGDPRLVNFRNLHFGGHWVTAMRPIHCPLPVPVWEADVLRFGIDRIPEFFNTIPLSSRVLPFRTPEQLAATRRAYYVNNRERLLASARERYANMSDEDKTALLAAARVRYANMSDEDKTALLAAARERYANMSDEDKTALLAAARERYANMSDEDKTANLAAARERYANMSDEDRERRLAARRVREGGRLRVRRANLLEDEIAEARKEGLEGGVGKTLEDRIARVVDDVREAPGAVRTYLTRKRLTLMLLRSGFVASEAEVDRFFVRRE
ncbi:hypothetical protein ScalyP_jg1530, partial [Parmales sp. scaly parma]